MSTDNPIAFAAHFMCLLSILFLTACGASADGRVTMIQAAPDSITYSEMTVADGVVIEFGLYLPPGFDPERVYPILLAFPPGNQTMDLVRWGMDTYWAPGARANDWIVVSPAAPAGQLFFRGSERYVPEFMGQIGTWYRPEGDKFYLGGVSNGGRSAFRVALERPDMYQALAALPGFPPSADDFGRIGDISALPVALWVGADDAYWVEQMEATASALTAAGGSAQLTIVAGEGHVLQSLAGGESLFAFLESVR